MGSGEHAASAGRTKELHMRFDMAVIDSNVMTYDVLIGQARRLHEAFLVKAHAPIDS